MSKNLSEEQVSQRVNTSKGLLLGNLRVPYRRTAIGSRTDKTASIKFDCTASIMPEELRVVSGRVQSEGAMVLATARHCFDRNEVLIKGIQEPAVFLTSQPASFFYVNHEKSTADKFEMEEIGFRVPKHIIDEMQSQMRSRASGPSRHLDKVDKMLCPDSVGGQDACFSYHDFVAFKINSSLSQKLTANVAARMSQIPSELVPRYNSWVRAHLLRTKKDPASQNQYQKKKKNPQEETLPLPTGELWASIGDQDSLMFHAQFIQNQASGSKVYFNGYVDMQMRLAKEVEVPGARKTVSNLSESESSKLLEVVQVEEKPSTDERQDSIAKEIKITPSEQGASVEKAEQLLEAPEVFEFPENDKSGIFNSIRKESFGFYIQNHALESEKRFVDLEHGDSGALISLAGFVPLVVLSVVDGVDVSNGVISVAAPESETLPKEKLGARDKPKSRDNREAQSGKGRKFDRDVSEFGNYLEDGQNKPSPTAVEKEDTRSRNVAIANDGDQVLHQIHDPAGAERGESVGYVAPEDQPSGQRSQGDCP